MLSSLSRFARTVLEEQLVKLVLIVFGLLVIVFAIRSEWLYPLIIGGLLFGALALRQRMRTRDA